MLSRIACACGKVHCVLETNADRELFGGRTCTADEVQARIESAKLANVETVARTQDLPAGGLDVVAIIHNYRDIERVLPNRKRSEWLAAALRTLKPGGGVGVEQRADRLKACAALLVGRFGGDLSSVLASNLPEARRALARFPAIGPPGAEAILLLCGAHPVLALDSSALRVLLRLGYGVDEGDYARTHARAQAAAESEVPATVPARRRAFLLLRRHGLAVCRRSAPECPVCPLRASCPASTAPDR